MAIMDGVGDFEDDDDFETNGTENYETSNVNSAKATPATKEGPHFSDDTLPDIFASEKWAGQTKEMTALWEQVPAPLKEKFDFSSAYSNARQRTLKQNHPKKDVFKNPPTL